MSGIFEIEKIIGLFKAMTGDVSSSINKLIDMLDEGIRIVSRNDRGEVSEAVIFRRNTEDPGRIPDAAAALLKPCRPAVTASLLDDMKRSDPEKYEKLMKTSEEEEKRWIKARVPDGYKPFG